MRLLQNVSLQPYNTFGIDAAAEFLTELESTQALEAVAADTALPAEKHIIGGGSNILLTKNVSGLCLLNKIKGITVEKEDINHVWLRVNSGEVWHELVMHAIGNYWGGIENLALIPGTVGAAPMQNIGAYGVEVKDTIESVTFWHWQERAFITYTNEQCRFGYRDSIFKQELKGQVFITSVVFRLNKQPKFNISYGAIEQELQKMNAKVLSLQSIAAAVINIRTSKLPDPREIGNAGSFFKNPTIPVKQYEALKIDNPSIPSYPVSNDLVKVPAGWLIEQCGWKGYRKGETGVHAKQALVLVNYGHAKGSDIWELSGEVLASVHQRFGIELEREVQVW